MSQDNIKDKIEKIDLEIEQIKSVIAELYTAEKMEKHKKDKIYKELCDIIDRSPTRTPEQVLSFFVSENIINGWEALDYETKYKKEHDEQAD